MTKIASTPVDTSMERYFFRASAENFRQIPGNPIAYWASQAAISNFAKSQTINTISTLKHGMSTSDNDRFMRQWYEVAASCFVCDATDSVQAQHSGGKWFPFCKGGSFRRWYGNHDYVVNWKNDGSEIKDEANRKYPYLNGKLGFVIGAESYYFEPAITWSSISSSTASFRDLPQGFVICNKGQTLYPNSGNFSDLLLGALNSCVSTYYLSVMSPTIGYELGYVGNIPAPPSEVEGIEHVGTLVLLTKADWDAYELSWEFTQNQLIAAQAIEGTVKLIYSSLRKEQRKNINEVRRLEQLNNRIFIEAYGLQDELTPDVPLEEITLTCNPHYRYGGNKTDEELEALLLADTMREFCSYAVGCMFGRYSLDKPGLVLANQGDTVKDYLKQVPESSFMPDEDNVIPVLDAEWFPDDVTERFRKFLRVTFGEEHYEENLAFVENGLNIKGKRNYSIRDFFVKEFYAYHVKLYKKRPIYWLFASPKGTFQALIYLHRYRPDTVSVVLGYLRDFRTKLETRKGQLERRANDADTSQGEATRLTREIEKLGKQILELTDYERDVLHPLASQRLEIDLDDGVKANYPKFGAALKKVPGLEAKSD